MSCVNNANSVDTAYWLVNRWHSSIITSKKSTVEQELLKVTVVFVLGLEILLGTEQ